MILKDIPSYDISGMTPEEIRTAHFEFGGTVMHTSNIQGYTIHHNGDYSGEIKILVPMDHVSEYVQIVPEHSKPAQMMFNLPFEVIKHLVGDYMKTMEISAIEQMDGAEYVEYSICPNPDTQRLIKDQIQPPIPRAPKVDHDDFDLD